MADTTAATYWQATRHPWSCALFVVPFLAAYELGIRWLAPNATAYRNGADAWLRDALAVGGIHPAYAPPAALLLGLLAWAVYRHSDRPADQAGVCACMALESLAFAALLLILSQGLWQVVQSVERLAVPGVRAATLSWPGPDGGSTLPAVEMIVGFLGAGIYEETLFRLLLFSGLFGLFMLADISEAWGFALAAAGSSLLFAAAHHLGPNGEAFNAGFFAFRTAAGVYFAALYRYRGFGIAVGAHAIYDVMVGLLMGAS
jgi:membrane protease YdiL (CAAX protease family)